MAGLDAASGVTTPHGDTVMPYDQALSPGLATVTPTVQPSDSPVNAGPQVSGVRDLTGERLGQLAGYEQDIAAAQSYAMSTRDAMLGHYQGQGLPFGAQMGDNLVMPVVPDNAVVPASSDQYPWPGDEPVPSSAGPGYGGNEPS